MSKKIYVGNMSYNIDENQLADIFADFGDVVSAKVIIDQMTGRSKGFAFVEMANEEDAAAAIEEMNGKEVMGRELRVNEAHDKPRRNNFQRDNRY